jgi:hypothetical protein
MQRVVAPRTLHRKRDPRVPPPPLIDVDQLSKVPWVNGDREMALFSDIPHRGFLLREDWDRPYGLGRGPGTDGLGTLGPAGDRPVVRGGLLGLATLPKPLNR